MHVQKKKRVGAFKQIRKRKYKEKEAKSHYRTPFVHNADSAPSKVEAAVCIIDTLRVRKCEYDALYQEVLGYSQFKHPTRNAVLTYARHYRTNYDSVIESLVRNRMAVFIGFAKLAANEVLLGEWPLLIDAAKLQAAKTIFQDKARNNPWAGELAMAEDGSTNWRECLNQGPDQ